MNKDEIIKFANGLFEQAFDANCYFSMIEQYRQAEEKYKDVLEYFPAFYNLTYSALLKSCFMEIAKLYDNNPISIGELLNVCDNNQVIFPKYKEIIEDEVDGKRITIKKPYQHILKKEEEIFFRKDVEDQRNMYKIFDDCEADKIPVQKDLTFPEVIGLYKKRYNSLSKKRENLRTQRNKIYAHNDIKAFLNDTEIIKKYPISFSDLKELIQFALDVTRMVIGILTNISKPELYSNIKDFDSILKYAKIGVDKQKKKEKLLDKKLNGK